MKRGEMSIQVIVWIALALICLVVLAYVFKDQIGTSAGQVKNVNKETANCLTNPSDPKCQEKFGGTTTSTSDNAVPKTG